MAPHLTLWGFVKSSLHVGAVISCGWQGDPVIVSLLYKVARRLLSVPGALLRRDTARDAEVLVLRHESAVLRRQPDGPVRYEPADRFWFACRVPILTHSP
ncbi:hypothetical protein [Streptomyces hirsutus]|uniref:hypothetical protein n=1 Tax=Streptomyces hirsutus TaxID=35620 RepID=UPI0036A2971B